VNRVTLAEFQSDTPEAAAEVWRDAAEGVLLEADVSGHYVRASKTAVGYAVLVSNPSHAMGRVVGVNCGCALSDRWHWHHWEVYGEPEKAAETVAWAIDAIGRGVSVKLAHSTQMPF
jgi:hypothetical protein